MEKRKLNLYCSYCGQKIYEYCWVREGSLDYHQECFNKKKKEAQNDRTKS